MKRSAPRSTGPVLGEPRFSLGQIIVTKGARAELHAADVLAAFERHAHGDWGEITAADWQENETALLRLKQLMSVYRDRAGRKFWIITTDDRARTIVMLPEEVYLYWLCYRHLTE